MTLQGDYLRAMFCLDGRGCTGSPRQLRNRKGLLRCPGFYVLGISPRIIRLSQGDTVGHTERPGRITETTR